MPEASRRPAFVLGLIASRVRRVLLALFWVFGLRSGFGAPIDSVRVDQPAIHDFQIDLSDAAIDSLRLHPREDVTGTLTLDGGRSFPVSLHLKGSRGSFRAVDDRPSLTLRFDPAGVGRGERPMRTLHLNNSVEDASLLQEALGARWFRRAGIPAPEVGHARVRWKGVARGLYVVVQGMDSGFLESSFPGSGAVSLGEVDPAPSLRSLVAEPDSDRRYRLLTQLIDVAECIDYLAVEGVMGHRDGYLAARNNFRVVERSISGRRLLSWIPHGLDLFVGTPEFPWSPTPGGLVARWILEHPEGRQRYELRVRHWMQTWGSEADWVREYEAVKLPFLKALTSAERETIQPAADQLGERLRQRYRGLAFQLGGAVSAPGVLVLGPGDSTVLTEWIPEPIGAGIVMEIQSSREGTPWLHTRVQDPGAGVWRSKLRLAPGKYRMEGRIRTSQLVALPFGRVQGASLRLVNESVGSSPLLGDLSWNEVGFDFEVKSEPMGAVATPVELACEVRASRGEAWFDRGSLRLRRLR